MPLVPRNVLEPVLRGDTFRFELFFQTLVWKFRATLYMRFSDFFGLRGRKSELFKRVLGSQSDVHVIYMIKTLFGRRGSI